MTINRKQQLASAVALLTMFLTAATHADKFATPDYGPVTNASELLIQKPDYAPAGQWTVAHQPPRITFSSVRGLEANPGHDDWLWTNFGEGFHGSNGKFYVAFGNNAAIDGNCCIYEYDPKTHQQRRVLDMAELLKQKSGQFGHGKLHGRLDEMPDGWVYMATYCSLTSQKISDQKRCRLGSRFVRMTWSGVTGPCWVITARSGRRVNAASSGPCCVRTIIGRSAARDTSARSRANSTAFAVVGRTAWGRSITHAPRCMR